MTNDMIYKFQDFLGIEKQNPFTILEAKATESKTTKEVNEKEVAGYDYKTNKNLNNQIFAQYINGLRFEMEQTPELLANNPSEALLKAKDIVAKNLEKDPLYYMKNAAFGIDGLGYTELENGKEPTGKHKSSGYGDLKENKMNKSTQLKELLEEAVAGIPSIGNPFAKRKNQAYEDKFAASSFKNLSKLVKGFNWAEGIKGNIFSLITLRCFNNLAVWLKVAALGTILGNKRFASFINTSLCPFPSLIKLYCS